MEINWNEIDKDFKKKFDEISIKASMVDDSHSSLVISNLISLYLEEVKKDILEKDKREFSEEKMDIINSLLLNISKIDKSIKENITILQTFPNFEIDKIKLLLILDAYTDSLKNKYARNL